MCWVRKAADRNLLIRSLCCFHFLDGKKEGSETCENKREGVTLLNGFGSPLKAHKTTERFILIVTMRCEASSKNI